MNKIIIKFLLSGDKFMPELHLKQPVFTYSACGPFTKHRERIQIFKDTGHLKHLHRNELKKACFAHGAAYCDSKGLAKRVISDNILKDRAYENATNCQYDGCHRALASIVCVFFDKKLGSGITVNEKVAKEIHTLAIEKLKRRQVYARFKDNIWVADLAEIQSLSSKNKNAKYLLYVIDVFTKYAWVRTLRDKRGKTVLNAFIETVNESNP